MLDQTSLLQLPLPGCTATLTLAGDDKGAMLLGGGAVWRFDGKAWKQAGKLPLDGAVEGTVEDGKGRVWAWAGDQLAPASGSGAALSMPGKVVAATADGKNGPLFWLEGLNSFQSWRTGGRGKKAATSPPALPDGVEPSRLVTCGETVFAFSDDAFGFRTWRLERDGDAWAQVLEPGAGRHGMAPHVEQALSAGPGFAIVVSGPGAAKPLNPAPPAGTEVLLVRADGSDYDLLVGEPRMSPQGLKVPASLMGPGFDAQADGSAGGQTAGAIVGMAISGRRLLLLEETATRHSARLRLTAQGPDPASWETLDLNSGTESETESGTETDRLRPGLVPAGDGLYIATSGGLFRLEL